MHHRMTSYRTLLSIALIAFAVVLAVADVAHSQANDATPDEASATDVGIVPDPVVQAEIHRIMTSPEMVTDAIDEDSQRADLAKVWRQLKEKVGATVLVPQLVHYSMHGQDVAQSMAFLLAMNMLELANEKISDTEIVIALVPYLPTKDSQLKTQIKKYLKRTEDWHHGRPTYSHYAALIEAAARAGDEPSRVLILHMYESHPGEAVLTMMSALHPKHPLAVDDRKPIFWSEHLVDDVLWKWKYGFLPKNQVEPEALDALARLAVHEQWWARLYVVEVMRQHPAFRSPVLIELLRDDSDASVRAVMECMLPAADSHAH